MGNIIGIVFEVDEFNIILNAALSCRTTNFKQFFSNKSGLSGDGTIYKSGTNADLFSTNIKHMRELCIAGLVNIFGVDKEQRFQWNISFKLNNMFFPNGKQNFPQMANSWLKCSWHNLVKTEGFSFSLL